MGLNDTTKWQEIQSKFKPLSKNIILIKIKEIKKFEDKLKKITLAYSQLKKTFRKKATQHFLAKPDMKISSNKLLDLIVKCK